MIHFHIITLFPDFFQSPLETGILGNAISDGHVKVSFYHLIDYKETPNKRVDDVPYGGGAGMLLRPEPVARAIEDAKSNAGKDAPVIHFTPRGDSFRQEHAESFSTSHKDYILLCGRYEGVDQRVVEEFVDFEFMIGETIVTGGEYPALYFVDSISRLLPEVLGNEDSPEEESFSKKLDRKKEYPHYTRPEEWRGKKVPDILLSGHHKNIENWRKDNLL